MVADNKRPGLGIEREILIEAPAEVVWRTITEPDQITQWFADRVDLVVEPGAHGYMGFGDQGGPVVVEAVEPPRRFSFRWNHPRDEEPVVGNSMLVEFTLTPEGLGPDGGERTRLRVTESGHELRDWPEAEKRRYADEHLHGWGEFLDRLAGVVAQYQSGMGQPGIGQPGRQPG
ncbi:MAG: SRPBCC domain-containing protein [Nocardiopsaceae bacterium]|nr:SRPBCC domain-containing protein [Nocardiopsaceae bacterium]